jgi:hypothetical protein
MIPAADGGEAYEIVAGEIASGTIILADHASNAMPPEFEALGLPAAELERHIGYDIGVAALTRALAARLSAPAVLSRFSRLLIDPEIGYVFDSLRPWSPRDLRLYLRRRVSYFLRQRQLDVLDAVPLRELPRDTRALDARLIETLRTDPRFAWSPWTRPAIRRLQARLARSAVAAG